MHEESKKHSKGANNPKEQRKRRSRQENKPEKNLKHDKDTKADIKAEKPERVPYEPPPEFYKNLKKETDEILKITEEANAKYKKKEILSNWAKYEMPIETYEDIDDQENLGADYETLANIPLSIGGHFQFKHEKSWDTSSGPNPYDKYFEINMEMLNIAISTIPFNERNGIDLEIFIEADIKNMNHRATKFKQKFFNDKKFMTPEMEAQEKILRNLAQPNQSKEEDNLTKDVKDIDLSNVSNVEEKTEDLSNKSSNENIDILCNKRHTEKPMEDKNKKINVHEVLYEIKKDTLPSKSNKEICLERIEAPSPKDNSKIREVPSTEPVKNPVIESPEDLEKWLDDFLDE
ncbi:unnamed protein product [Leptosia nina]|uniref:Uncharacterized protein n=1 Tax=Leptosia nina TaxID=320188 RepID=A0AAV1J3G9_9NEOP